MYNLGKNTVVGGDTPVFISDNNEQNCAGMIAAFNAAKNNGNSNKIRVTALGATQCQTNNTLKVGGGIGSKLKDGFSGMVNEFAESAKTPAL